MQLQLARSWRVGGDSVAILEAIEFQDVCNAAGFTKQFRVHDIAILARLVCLIDDGSLIELDWSRSDEIDEGETDVDHGLTHDPQARRQTL